MLPAVLGPRGDGDREIAWHRPNLQGPETLAVTSPQFSESSPIPREHVSERIGGSNLSPGLVWAEPPGGSTWLLVVVEDPDVPLGKPFVHCLALIDPARLDTPYSLEPGALSSGDVARGVTVLRSTIGQGYQGPQPPKGRGPHRYVFQTFALAGTPPADASGAQLERAKPRDVLASISAPVLARGRLVGIYER